jgi:hypothetical protein
MLANKRVFLRTTALLAGGFLLFAASAAQAGEPRIGQVIVTNSDDGQASQDSFSIDAAKILVRAQLVDMKDGTKVSVTWIAEKTEVAPPDFRIEGSELSVVSTDSVATFFVTKPTAGWPVGDYRAELSIDGRSAGVARFKVAA